MRPLHLSASLVVYKSEFKTLYRTLLALQNAGRRAKNEYPALNLSVTLVDNSEAPDFHRRLAKWVEQFQAEMPDWHLQLLLSPGNVGYGRGNNLVIDSVVSDYHIVINPDLFVHADALLAALHFMEENSEVGLLTPAVFGEDGQRHYLCKRHPTLLTMFLRSFSPQWLQSKFGGVIREFEMRDCDYEKSIHPVEYPTGCFMFFRTSALQEIGGFDPDFFLHYEDADIGRRILQIARVVYVPRVRVTHQWARDTHRSISAKLITVRSGLLYWWKWGGAFCSSSAAEFSSRVGHTVAAISSDVGAGRMVLVTGADGFIGRATCSSLARRGYRVRQAVRGNGSAVNSEFFYVMGEMNEGTEWGPLLAQVESVVHLAARVHLMRDSAADPLAEFRRTNVAMTLNLARQAAQAGVKRFIFISSIKVNGESTPVGQPFTAEDLPKPTDPYGISKYEAEQGLLQLAAESGMEVVVIRPVLVYGVGVKANFQSMMRWLLKGFPLPLGALPNRRSFLSLPNLVDLIATCLQHPAAANQIFLASDNEDLSISELLYRTGSALGQPARLIPIPVTILSTLAQLVGQEAVMQRLCEPLQVDITTTRRILGWTPPVNVDEALKETAQHFRRGST